MQRTERRRKASKLQRLISGLMRGTGTVALQRPDVLGFNVAENPVPVHDLQATILHLLGLDHTRLTYCYAGRDFRLTDVYGNVIKDILA